MNFLDRQAKFQVLQERALQLNQQYDELAEKDSISSDYQIFKTIHEREKKEQLANAIAARKKERQDPHLTVSVNNTLPIQFPDTHKVLSTTQEQQVLAAQAQKSLKQTLQDKEAKAQFQTQNTLVKRIDDQRKNFLYMTDHVDQLLEGVTVLEQKNTHKREAYADITKQAKNYKPMFNNKKNEMIQYADAFIISKGFLRNN